MTNNAMFQSKKNREETKKYRIVIRDFFTAEENDVDDLLNSLDPGDRTDEKSHRPPRGRADDRVACPEVYEIESDYCRSGAHWVAPDRCFTYDRDYFEPIIYSADDNDIAFIDGFNKKNKFLRMSEQDLERIFVVCESLVKDSFTETPTLSQVMLVLGGDAPPVTVIEAIFKHWENRERYMNSMVRWLEFPPEHFQLRNDANKTFRDQNKSRKGMKSCDYMKRLFHELGSINEEREKIKGLLETQEVKRNKDERFVRDRVRQIRGHPAALLVQATPIAAHEPASRERVADTATTTIPVPPTSPSFLKWCMGQKLGSA